MNLVTPAFRSNNLMHFTTKNGHFGRTSDISSLTTLANCLTTNRGSVAGLADALLNGLMDLFAITALHQLLATPVLTQSYANFPVTSSNDTSNNTCRSSQKAEI